MSETYDTEVHRQAPPRRRPTPAAIELVARASAQLMANPRHPWRDGAYLTLETPDQRYVEDRAWQLVRSHWPSLRAVGRGILAGIVQMEFHAALATMRRAA